MTLTSKWRSWSSSVGCICRAQHTRPGQVISSHRVSVDSQCTTTPTMTTSPLTHHHHHYHRLTSPALHMQAPPPSPHTPAAAGSG